MKMYCPNCGGVTEYSLEKPRFCGACGKSFLGAVASVPTIKTPEVVRAKVVMEDEDDIDGPLPEIDKIQVDVQVEKPTREKFGGVINSGSTGFSRGDGKKMTKAQQKVAQKKMIEDFKRETSSSRGRNAE